MKLLLAILVCAVALPLVASPASATPPVCLEKGATVLTTSVDVRLTCGPRVAVVQCPPVGEGPCLFWSTDNLLA